MTEITRSEEQMRIGTERHESGRVRVHKYVETEMVERTIPVSHEELKIDREPIVGGEPNPKVTISEDDHEIILYEERPVIARRPSPSSASTCAPSRCRTSRRCAASSARSASR